MRLWLALAMFLSFSLLSPLPSNAQDEAGDKDQAPELVEWSSGDRIAAVALSYEGYPYLWGGQSPAWGFDCSGLVRWSYGIEGRYIPSTWLPGLLGNGPAVSTDELLPGDLLFFDTWLSGRASHVGIYVGEGRFVHAASPAYGVIVSDLARPYYQARFLGATRPWE